MKLGHHPGFFFALLLFAGCVFASPRMPAPAEFVGSALAGTTKPEAFDFEAGGYWRLPKHERLAWFSGVAQNLGLDKPSPDECAADAQRRFATLNWVNLAAQATDAAEWQQSSKLLRERLAEFDQVLEKSAPATPSADPLVQELRVRFTRDQDMRRAMMDPRWTQGLTPHAEKNWMPLYLTRMVAIDCANTAWLRKQLETVGWFSIPKYGEAADSAAWTLVQHADRSRDFQRAGLAKLEALPPGDTNPRRIGTLWDRVAIGEGRPQRYGTQGKCQADGTWKPFDPEDPAHLDERRAKLGMAPIAEHAKTVAEKSCRK